MELGKAEIQEAQGGAPHELGFDPDKLIGGIETHEADARAENPEAALHDPEQLAAPVEGLEQTQQGFEQLDNGNTRYDHPQETGTVLNSNQGEAVKGFVQDCGLVSAENVCKLAGKDISEADVIAVARKNKDCDDHVLFHAEDNGGATSDQICDVLSHLGVNAEVKGALPINEVAGAVESGRGVIACVDVSKFWESWPFPGGHAVTLTSVERNPAGDVVAFYVCDSGTGGEDACRRVEADRLSNSLRETLITEKPIW